MALYGYARVRTDDQELDLQIDDLKKTGCDEANIYSEKVSGVKSDRPALDACIASLKEAHSALVSNILTK